MSSVSGKFVLRLDPRLHLLLKQQASKHRVSLNQWIAQNLGAHAPLEELNRVGSDIRNAFDGEIEGLVLFGSAARGERRESSDIDLLIVLKKTRAIDRSLYQIWDEQITSHWGDVYSSQFCHLKSTSEASSLWLEVAIEGEIIYDESGLIKKYIREWREKIAEGVYIRKVSHGQTYWIQQKDIHAK